MPKIYHEVDCDISVLKGKTVAITGYDSQSHTHALSLHDSGIDVVVGLYEDSRSAERAKKAGLKVLAVSEATKVADIIMILIPDERQAEMYRKGIEPNLVDGKVVAFVHDFNIHFGQIEPPRFADIFTITSRGPGYTVRSEFQKDEDVPHLVAIEQDCIDHTLDVALAYGAGIGGARTVMMGTTFRVEAETDPFGEQMVLCSGVCTLMKAGFETLVETDYAPENAYFECTYEMKLIVDLIYKNGFELMRYSIFDTVGFGDYKSGKRLTTGGTKKEMKQILSEIQDGTSAGKWIAENRNNRAHLNAMCRIGPEHQPGSVGKELRKMHSWSEEDKYID